MKGSRDKGRQGYQRRPPSFLFPSQVSNIKAPSREGASQMDERLQAAPSDRQSANQPRIKWEYSHTLLSPTAAVIPCIKLLLSGTPRSWSTVGV